MFNVCQRKHRPRVFLLIRKTMKLSFSLPSSKSNSMKPLPEDQGFDDCNDVSVEGFAAALLAGYGWSEGMGIGKSAKENGKVVEFKRWTAREGLGFVADASEKRKRKTKKEKTVRIVGGRYAGFKKSKIREKGSKNKRGRDEVEEKRWNEGKKQVSWLTSHIRVRVISRDFKGGKLYLKKGEVLDVVGPATCDIYMNESREIIQGVSQDILETAIPRRGGPVLVLYGKHKGAFGSLIERNQDSEIGIVRDADTDELLNVKLDQIAEYIGDPSLLGY